MNISSLLKKKISRKLYNRLIKISDLSKAFNLEPYLVGGVVRDLLYSAPIKKDIDITVTGGDVSPLASALAKERSAEVVSYPAFLTFTILFKDNTHLDLVTARQETYPYPASLPVVKAGTLETDLRRRDFSINAIAVSLSRENWGEVMDPLDGISDLQAKRIRVLHTKSFEDDPTRIFRAARFSARFGFRLEKDTFRLIQQSVKDRIIKKLSYDRMRVELEKILMEENPAAAIRLLHQWNILKQVHPDLRWDSQNLMTLKMPNIEENGMVLAIRLAQWLCGNSFIEAEDIMRTLNFPKDVVEKVSQSLKLYDSFRKNREIISLPRSPLFPETVHFFNLLKWSNKFRKIKNLWKDYQVWLKCKPGLDGNALKSLGYSEGPLFKKIFQKISVAKFERKLRTKAGEIKFVIDNFRRD